MRDPFIYPEEYLKHPNLPPNATLQLTAPECLVLAHLAFGYDEMAAASMMHIKTASLRKHLKNAVKRNNVGNKRRLLFLYKLQRRGYIVPVSAPQPIVRTQTL